MAGFKATRIKIGGITYDLDKPIKSDSTYQKIKRMPQPKAIEELIKNECLDPTKVLKRHKIREDGLIRALKAVGSLLVP